MDTEKILFGIDGIAKPERQIRTSSVNPQRPHLPQWLDNGLSIGPVHREEIHDPRPEFTHPLTLA